MRANDDRRPALRAWIGARSECAGLTTNQDNRRAKLGQVAIVPSLIVMNSRGATLQGNKLTLTGMSPNSIVFADRPVRAAGHQLTARLA